MGPSYCIASSRRLCMVAWHCASSRCSAAMSGLNHLCDHWCVVAGCKVQARMLMRLCGGRVLCGVKLQHRLPNPTKNVNVHTSLATNVACIRNSWQLHLCVCEATVPVPRLAVAMHVCSSTCHCMSRSVCLYTKPGVSQGVEVFLQTSH